MIKDALIIIPNLSSEDQVCDFLSQTARILAKNNLVFVPTFSGKSENYIKNKIHYLRFFQVLPFKRFEIINRLNKIIYFFLLRFYLNFKFYKYEKRYVWMFFPEIADILKIKVSGWKIIFDIVDFHYYPDKNKQILLNKNRKYLLEKSDYIFTISNTMLKKYLRFIKKESINLKNKIKLVPQGFDLNSFSKTNKPSKLLLPKGKPLIGFIGQISERLDFNLIKELIANNRNSNFIFVGPWHHESNVPENSAYKDIFKKICMEKNCFYFGRQAKKTMLSIIKQFDICIIPYDTSFEFNKYSYPMKIFEYFYARKPVISTEIKELERFSDFVKISNYSKDWQIEIKKLLSNPWSSEKKMIQRRIAKENSWENKLENIYEFIK